MEKELYIYCLYTEGEEIKYIGKTDNLNKRLSEHVYRSKKNKTHKDRWIQKRLKENKEILIKLIEVCNENSWEDREKYWIKYYRNTENGITNHSDGGYSGGGIIFTKPYEEVKQWVNENLKIKSSNDCKNQIKYIDKPDYIPSDPRTVYFKRGWVSWGDFLQTGNKYDNDVNYITYNETKEYIKENLSHIKSLSQWKKGAKNNEIPEFIPNRPERYYGYKNRGWVSWGNFLNTGRIQNNKKIFLSYEESREYARNLKLKSVSEWYIICKKNIKPNNIPSAPNQQYKNKGWIDYSDFLGTEIISDNELHANYYSYDDAKKYVKNNYSFLKSSVQWEKYFKLNKLPIFIPLNPNISYKNKGWKGWGEFLNTGNIRNEDKIFLPYEEAKKIVHQYSLQSNKEWRVFSKTKAKELKIPTGPDKSYLNKGWVDWYDWLGNKKGSN